MTKNQYKKKVKKWTLVIAAILLFSVLLLVYKAYSPMIFQKGNPIPYLRAATQIDENHPYAQVDVNSTSNIYISPLKDYTCESLFNDIAYSKGFEFVEQMGDAYCFTDGKNMLIIESEVYGGRYHVWTVPNITLQ